MVERCEARIEEEARHQLRRVDVDLARMASLECSEPIRRQHRGPQGAEQVSLSPDDVV